MLKHLLSASQNADSVDPNQQQSFQQVPGYDPTIEYKYEPHHQHNNPPTSTDSPTDANSVPSPHKFHFDQQQYPLSGLASSTIRSTPNNNNTICQDNQISYSSGLMNEDVLGFEPASNTSDFLSSTFSLLTSDTLADPSSIGEWPQYSLEQLDSKQPRVFYDSSQQIYYSQPTGYPLNSHYLNVAQHEDQMQQQQMHEMQTIHHLDSLEPAEKRAKKTSGPSARNCQLEYTENFKRFINIPTTQQSSQKTPPSQNQASTTPQRSISAHNSDSGVQSPVDSDESDSNTGGQTIQCPACKSVYSSPRSLTGHIGRTEKCREMIGRDYLDEIAKMGKSGCIPDPSSIAGEGISPVCPHCERFISHYKGNIRRHVNSCTKKGTGRKDSGSSAVEPTGSNSSNASLASYDTTSTPNPSHHEDHQTQPCSSSNTSNNPASNNNKDLTPDYTLQPMHSQPIQHHHPQVHTIHFAHPEDNRHPIHHSIPPYHLIPPNPLHHVLQPPSQNQMTLITHLQPQPIGSHHLHQAPMHPYSMDYMPYESLHHQQIQPLQNLQSAPQNQQYEITYVRTSPESTQATQITPNGNEGPVMKLPKLKHNGMVPVNDPYFCQWCTFSTVYKGNMKRHLISCHNCTDELLRQYNFELERLRKSNPHPANPDCLPFIEIKPPQPPGTRRPRNPPTNKSLGRPKKNNSTNSDKPESNQSQQQFEQLRTEYIVEPQQLQYSLLQPPQHQIKLEYGQPSMAFMSANGQLIHPQPNQNTSYIIKDCANDSGLGMELSDYNGSDVLHQPQALPGY